MLRQSSVFNGFSSIQFFNSSTSLNTSASCHHPCLGKRRVSLGVGIILRVCLCLHSQLTSQQKVLLGRFYLCVRDWYRTYQPLAGFELALLLIALYVVRCLFYPLGHKTFKQFVLYNYIYMIINNTQTKKHLFQSTVTQFNCNSSQQSSQ